MVVTLFPDGIPCVVKEETDLSFLHRWGRVFRVFDRQDSGNLCFGLEREGRRYFLKYAGARPLCLMASQRGCPPLGKIRPGHSGPGPPGTAAPAVGWARGRRVCAFVPLDRCPVHGKAISHRAAFLALPVEKKLAVFQAVLAFHRYVAERGYVSVDFYDAA